MSPGSKLLLDGLRIVLQILVNECHGRMTEDTKGEIQQWYDRCYELLHALADEILKYRRALRLLAKAIGWADAGAPFALIAPGPHWRPRRTSEGDVAPPAA